MSHTKEPELRGLLIDETANALLVAKDRSIVSERAWVPRSQVGYLRKTKTEVGTEIVFTLPEWMVEEKRLWTLVP